MNWFKSAKEFDWGWEEFGHLLNVMRFEIDNFPRLIINENKEGLTSLHKIGFYINRDDGKEYHFALERVKNQIKTYVALADLSKIINHNFYEISQYTPQQIINEGLITINNDSGNDFNERSENELV